MRCLILFKFINSAGIITVIEQFGDVHPSIIPLTDKIPSTLSIPLMIGIRTKDGVFQKAYGPTEHDIKIAQEWAEGIDLFIGVDFGTEDYDGYLFLAREALGLGHPRPEEMPSTIKFMPDYRPLGFRERIAKGDVWVGIGGISTSCEAAVHGKTHKQFIDFNGGPVSGYCWPHRKLKPVHVIKLHAYYSAPVPLP